MDAQWQVARRDGGLAGALWQTQGGPPFTFTGHSRGAQKLDRLLEKPGSSLAELKVQGHLVARGTASQPITFTSVQSSPQPGDWMGLAVRSGARARLGYVDLAYAGYGKRTAWYQTGCTNPDYLPLPGEGAGGVWVEDYVPVPAYPDLVLSHSRIHHNRGSGVVFHGSGFRHIGIPATICCAT